MAVVRRSRRRAQPDDGGGRTAGLEGKQREAESWQAMVEHWEARAWSRQRAWA
jgi:hypothetical protein